MGEVLSYIPSANGEKELTCIGSSRINHFANSELRQIGMSDDSDCSRPTAFEAEPNHSHLLVLDDGTNWTAPGLELEFRARLEALLENGFQQEVPCAPLTERDLPTAGPAVEGETAIAQKKQSESTNAEQTQFALLKEPAVKEGTAKAQKKKYESARAKQEPDEDIDEEEKKLEQLAQDAEANQRFQPSLAKPVCVLVIGGSFGTLSICYYAFYLLNA